MYAVYVRIAFSDDSVAAKQGKASILAVTTDDGAVELVNTARCKGELARKFLVNDDDVPS